MTFPRAAGFLLLGAGCLAAAPLQAEWRQVASQHFTVRYETPYPPAGVLNDLETLHGKLLLDLIHFAPWARDQRIEVTLYATADRYRSETGAASWAAGHVKLKERQVYTYESTSFRKTMAHELAHLFFDDFFMSQGQRAPLWLNEGVATLMEWEYGREDQLALASAATYPPLEEFLNFSYRQSPHRGRQVSLWYQQAYGLVRYLMRQYGALQFMEFCRGIRAGESLDKALSGAYGFQVPDGKALERLWKKSLTKAP